MNWKNIPNYECLYEVSDTGLVRNWSTWRTLTTRLCKKDGSYLVTLTNNYVKSTFIVHRLVAQAYIPNPEGKRIVKHIDGDKSNNNVDNLYWTNRKQKPKGDANHEVGK